MTSAVSKTEILYVIANKDDDTFNPGPESRSFHGTIRLAETNSILRAYAKHADMEDSSVIQSGVFTIEAAPPTFDPLGGTFTSQAEVNILSATPGAEIRCTTNGDVPTETTAVCPMPVVVKTTGTMIKAVATKEGMSVSTVASLQSAFVIKSPVPSISPNGGIFTESATATLTSSNPTARIFYTLDASTPTADSAVYTEPIVIEDTDTVVKAIAVAVGKAPSEPLESKVFTVEAGQVQFEEIGIRWDKDVPAGEEGFVEQVKVHMKSTTAGSSIYYTLDGSVPTVNSPKYNGEEAIDHTYGESTIQAVAIAPGKAPSPIAESKIIDIFQRDTTPEISPAAPGPYVTSVEITINALPGSDVRVTADGSDPTDSPTATAYRAPFIVAILGEVQVKAVSSRQGKADSLVASKTYRILEQVKPVVMAPR
jgi:hypothetical protein